MFSCTLFVLKLTSSHSGCVLADDNTIAYVVAVVSLILACALEYFAWRQRKRVLDDKFVIAHYESSSNIPLQTPNVNGWRDEQNSTR
jgi:hypothetical protein